MEWLIRQLHRLENRIWVVRVMLMLRHDLFPLIRLYPGTWEDARFRYAIGLAMVREGNLRSDSTVVKGGEALTSGEFVPNLEGENNGAN